MIDLKEKTVKNRKVYLNKNYGEEIQTSVPKQAS